MPHGHCYYWTAEVLWSHVLSDAVIALSYYSIPIVLVIIVRRRRDLKFNWVFWAFAAFIFACGTTHAISIWTTWYGTYRLEGLIKIFTAAVSILTAIGLWPLLPKVLAIPSTAALEREINERILAEQKLRDGQLSLEQKIADRTKELSELNLTLREKNKELEDLVYFVAHDLKAPLITVLGFAGLLPDLLQQNRQDDLREYIRRMDSAGKRLRELIDRIVTYSRVGMSTAEQIEHVNLELLLERVNTNLSGLIKQHDATVKIETPLPIVPGIGPKFAQVFENVISNALKHACLVGGGIITITAEERETDWLVGIKDNGPGIAEADKERVFVLFERLNAQSEGSGLGLALARRIMQAFSGDIWVDSAPGKGATFWLRFSKNVKLAAAE